MLFQIELSNSSELYSFSISEPLFGGIKVLAVKYLPMFSQRKYPLKKT